MSRRPPKKRKEVFLDDTSSSGSESDASYAESDSGEESEAKVDDDEKVILSLSSTSSSDSVLADPFLQTQPQRLTRHRDKRSPVKVTMKKVRPSSSTPGSAVMEAYEMILPSEKKGVDPTGKDIVQKEKRNKPSADDGDKSVHGLRKRHESPHGDEDYPPEADSEGSRKPSKLRLKIKMKPTTTLSQESNRSNISSEASTLEGETKIDTSTKQARPNATDSLASLPLPSSPNTRKGNKRTLNNREQNVASCAEPINGAVKQTTHETSQSTSGSTPNSTQEVVQKEEIKKPPTSGVKRKKRKVAKQHSAANSSPNGASKTTTAVSAPSETSKSTTATSTPSKKFTSIPKPVSPKPTPKPKRKKKTFQEQVLLHMMTTMKPFTLKLLATELRTTDVALHHVMLSLVDKQIVRRKEVGKKVKKELYWVDLENATKEIYGKKEFSRDKAHATKQELNQILTRESDLLREIQAVESELSNNDLDKRIEEEEKSLQGLMNRINEAKERISIAQGGASAKTPATAGRQKFGSNFQTKSKPMTKKQLQKNINYTRAEWKSRKEKCVDFLDNLADAMEKKPKEVNKLLGIETDEMMGVKLPPKKVID